MRTRLEELLALKDAVEEMVPEVPPPEVLLAVRRCAGSIGGAQQHMDDWKLGKVIQMVNPGKVPWKQEDEHAAGYWYRVIRPELLSEAYAQLGVTDIDDVILKEDARERNKGEG